MNAITLNDLSKSYGKKFAVNHLNMVVPEGSIYGFIGQNGAGKSTTQKMICGLTPQTTGDMKLFGKLQTDAKMRSRVGMLIENAGAYPSMTAYENMKLYGLAIGAERLEEEIKRVLKLVGLIDTGKKKVKQFSLGMTILISSHILGELSKISTHYGIIKDGTMIREMTAEDLEYNCQNYMCIRLEHAQDAAARLKKTFSFEKCDLVEDRELHLLGNSGDTKAVNKYLYQNGFEVEEIYMHRQDLEEYFLGLMGGVKNA